MTIVKSQQALVKVVTLDAPEVGAVKCLGFLTDAIDVPDDFDQMGASEVEKLFQNDM